MYPITADTAQQGKADQLVELAESALAWAHEIKASSPEQAAHAVAAGKVYITLAAMVRTATPQRRWVSPALRTADMHGAEAGMEPCKHLVVALLYGQR